MILHGAVPFGSSLFLSPSRSVQRLLCISLWVVQGLHGGLPLLGVAFSSWASALVRVGGLFSDPCASVLRVRPPSGSRALFRSHLLASAGSHWLALDPSGWGFSLRPVTGGAVASVPP